MLGRKPQKSVTFKDDAKTEEERKNVSKSLYSHREFTNILEELDRIRKILPNDHAPINRTPLQIFQLYKKDTQNKASHYEQYPHVKVLLSSHGFDSTKFEEDAHSLMYSTLHPKKPRKDKSLFKPKDINIISYTQLYRKKILQSTVDMINSDGLEAMDLHSYANTASNWEKMTKAIMLNNRTFLNTRSPEKRFRSSPLKEKKKKRSRIDLFKGDGTTLAKSNSFQYYCTILKDYVSHKHTQDFNSELMKEYRKLSEGLESNIEIITLWNLLEIQTRDIDTEANSREDIFNDYINHDGKLFVTIIRSSLIHLENTFLNDNLEGRRKDFSSTSIFRMLDPYIRARFHCSLQNVKEVIPTLHLDKQDQPIYLIVFFLIRAGKYTHASHITKENSNTDINELGRLLDDYIKYGFSLSPNKKEQAINILNSFGDVKQDPFKEAIYIILTKYFKEPDLIIIEQMEDYLWFYLSICDAGNSQHEFENGGSGGSESSHSTITLNEFQNMVLRLGKTGYFTSSNQGAVDYPKILIYVGLYDQAIEALFSENQYFLETLHFAISLNELGLLLTTTSLMEFQPDLFEELKKKKEKKTIIDLRVEILKLTKSFQGSYPLECVIYFSTLPLTMFIEEVGNMIIDSNHYHILLENTYIFPSYLQMTNNSSESNFFNIQTLLTKDQFEQLTMDVAQHYTHQPHLLNIPIQLYNKIGKYEEALEMMIVEQEYLIEKGKPLDFTISKNKIDIDRNKQQREIFSVKEKYFKLVNQYLKMKIFSRHNTLDHTLKDMDSIVHYYNLLHLGKIHEALVFSKKLKFTPFYETDNVDEFINYFVQLPSKVQDLIPDFVLSSVIILNLLCKTICETEKNKFTKSLEEQNKIEQYRKVIGKLANYFEKILKILFQKSQIDHSADPNHHYKIIREQIMKIQISNTDM